MHDFGEPALFEKKQTKCAEPCFAGADNMNYMFISNHQLLDLITE